ncbi:hypothetical protein GN956_G20014 [Arapaima gigas]
MRGRAVPAALHTRLCDSGAAEPPSPPGRVPKQQAASARDPPRPRVPLEDHRSKSGVYLRGWHGESGVLICTI